jgi:hypothetical protein
VRFPSWKGDGTAQLWAVGPGGATQAVLGERALAGVRWFYVQSDDSGYAVVPRSVPAGARARLLETRPQSSAPRAGPSLAVELARASRTRALSASFRLIPAGDLATAKRLVASLG